MFFLLLRRWRHERVDFSGKGKLSTCHSVSAPTIRAMIARAGCGLRDAAWSAFLPALMLRSFALLLAGFGVFCAQAAEGPAPAAPAQTPPIGSAALAEKASAPAEKTGAVTARPSAAKVQITFSQCNVEGPFAAITFDDGPHGVQTPRLLKMLRDRGVRATFFVVGQCVAEYPEIAKQIVAEGHELANHSWSHPLLTKMGEDSVRDQLQRTHDVVKQETGATMTLMRPPYGGFTLNQRLWSHATWGYRCILWDVDSLDWKHRSPAKTQAISVANARPGSIILCHDIHKTTVDAMPGTLDGLLAKGLKLVTVSELLKMHNDKPAGARPVTPARSLTPNEGAGAATTLSEALTPAPAAVPVAQPVPASAPAK